MFGGRTGAFGACGDTGELRDDADSARRRLEIHGVPAPGADSWGNNRDEWPSLPGAPGFPARSSHWGGDPCPWAASLAKSRFSLGDSLWPSLASRQEQQRDDDDDAKHGHNPGLSGGLERNGAASIQCGDILATKGPTQQRSHQLVDQGRNGGANGDGDGFVVRGIDPGGGKGWMRLPPISMPSNSSSSNRQYQQQQKRCRQAAFFDGAPANSNSNSNPPSPDKGSNASSRGIGVIVDGVGSSSPPPPPPLPPTRGYLPPVYLMLNKDFVVISPLKENLLLTLALTQHRRVAPSSPRSFGYDEDDVVVDDDGGAANFAAAARLFQHESSPMDDDEEEVAQAAAVAAAAAAAAASVAAAATATATGIAATATAAVASSRDAKRRQVFVGRFEAFSSFVKFGLGRDAMRVATESNAGGTSTISESLSVEYFVRKFKATDVVTEMEVEYCAMNWKKVDYICNLYGQRVGVSVTRAMSYPNPDDFSPQMAYRLLYKKLFGLVVARHGVTDRHSFSQCILHVWCETTSTAKLLQAQYKEVSEELDITDDVIMVLTVAEGWHARPIFYESCLVRD